MWKWGFIRLRRRSGTAIKICLIFALCFYVPFQLHKQTHSSDDKEEIPNTNIYREHMSIGNELGGTILPGIRLRKHAKFRHMRFLAAKLKHVKLNEGSKALTLGSRKLNAGLKTKTPYARVIIKRRAMFRKKAFVRTRGRIFNYKTTKARKSSNRTMPSSSNLPNTQVDILEEWRESRTTACGGQVELYPGHFLSFRLGIFRKNLVWCQNVGGEAIEQVIGQKEESEYYKIHKGFFVTPCKESLKEFYLPTLHRGHLRKWLQNTTPYALNKTTPVRFITDFTIMVKRYEYVNIYHTMTDFYNAFLVMSFFEKSPNETTVIFFDAHPKGSLDSVWETLFGKTLRVSQLSNVTQFDHVVWGIPGYDSLISEFYSEENIPLLEEFRAFFLKQHDVIKTLSLDCNRGLRLVVIFRRDYVAHPRNPEGKVERKIGNEDELLKVAKRTGVFSSVVGIQLEKISMREQLLLISNTDILVGMHGAGLTHAIFLPQHAGVVELFPSYFSQLDHFLNICNWRRLKYLNWQNYDPNNELEGKRTRVPPSVFRALLLEMRRKVCGQKSNRTDIKQTAIPTGVRNANTSIKSF